MGSFSVWWVPVILAQDVLRDSKNLIIKTMSNAMAAWVSIEYNLEGPSYTIATACSSAAYAIASGYDLIKSEQM